jgi:1,4-alpha-glucan branching enzyme
MSNTRIAPRGRLAIVLHAHLPWVANHGTWPVGEEWLHQAWATSYQRLVQLLRRRADRGHRGELTLGVTPILAAQWDDPRLVAAQRTWLGYWQTRAVGMSIASDPDRRTAGQREYAEATAMIDEFERHWGAGGSAALRPLIDVGIIDVLGGPLTHTFTPLLPERLASASLSAGLDDARRRWGSRPTGAWIPECAWDPGMETMLSSAGVDYVMLDGPSLLRSGATTSTAWRLGTSDVAVVGRDLDVTYRVWSPRRGYPGNRWYRDFHSFDHEWGFRTRRVTGHRVNAEDKAPYDPVEARVQVERDARDFVDVVARRLETLTSESTQPLVVAAFDAELFGHWWHEGPAWLERVLDLMPEAGIELTTLAGAVAEPVGAINPGPGSWGLGKDWHIWTDPREIADRQGALAKQSLEVLDATHPRTCRSAAHDQLIREVLLALSSDWAFMVSHDSASDYARHRFTTHAQAAQGIGDALRRGEDAAARERAARAHQLDDPFGDLDARAFLAPPNGS